MVAHLIPTPTIEPQKCGAPLPVSVGSALRIDNAVRFNDTIIEANAHWETSTPLESGEYWVLYASPTPFEIDYEPALLDDDTQAILEIVNTPALMFYDLRKGNICGDVSDN